MEMSIFRGIPFTAPPLGELTGPGSLIIPWLVPAYMVMLEAVSKQGCNGYACIFDHVPANWKKEGFASVHAPELPYVFGDWDDSTGWWQAMQMSFQESGVKNPDPGLNTTDKKISEAMMGLWTEFAKTGKPKVQGVPNWPPYTPANDSYLYIGGTLEVRTGYSKLPD